MSLLAMIVITQWSEARLAATAIDARPWLAHLVDRIVRSRRLTRLVVVCHPDCLSMTAPYVPAGVAVVASDDALGWAATAGDADLVARVPVWQLFADPARLDALADVPRPRATTCVRAVYEHDAAIGLTGGAYVELFTRLGCAQAAAGLGASAGDVVAVPSAPEPPELRLRPAGDAGWGVTLQRAFLDAGLAHDLSAADAVITRAGLARFDFWRDAVGAGPRRVLTVRCLPAAQFARLLTHLRHLPSATIDVLCPSSLAKATAALPGVHQVLTFAGPSLNLERLDAGAIEALRRERYDLCVLPRRTPCGRGFENVLPLGAASGAATALWMDVKGSTGLLTGRPRGWEPWVTDAPPWLDPGALRQRAVTAFRSFLPAAAPPGALDDPAATAATRAAAIIARMDECVAGHALVDAVDAGIELAPLLLHQLPSVVSVHAAVARLRVDGRPAAARLATLVDRVLEHGVGILAACDAQTNAAARPEAVRRAADALAALAADVERAPGGSGDEARALAAAEDVARTLAAAGAAPGPGTDAWRPLEGRA